MSSCGWVVASPPRRRGRQVRAPWHHGGHGAVDVVGPVAPPGRASGHAMGTQECTQIGENGLTEPFWGIRVHCCDARVARVATRVATGGTSASTAMVCRRRPLGGHFLLVERTLRRQETSSHTLDKTPRLPLPTLRACAGTRKCRRSQAPPYGMAELPPALYT